MQRLYLPRFCVSFASPNVQKRPRAFRGLPAPFLRTMINLTGNFLWRFDSDYEYACNVRMTKILHFMWWKFLGIWMIVWRFSEEFFYSDYIYLSIYIYVYIWGGTFISCDAYMLCTTFLMAACFTRRSGNAFSPPI